MKMDGKPTTFSSKVDAAAGTVTISLSRGVESGGVSGSGILATASFKAKNKGPANFAFKHSEFTSSKGTALSILPFSTAVDVR